MLASFRLPLNASLRLVPFALVPLLACAIGVWYIHAQTGTDPSFFYRDANAIARQSFYYGSLEYASSAMLLMSSAVILYFASSERQLAATARNFCLAFGFLTLCLGVDDLLMVHENVYLINRRLSEIHVYGFYAVLLAFVSLRYLRVARETAYPLVLLSLLLLVLAAAEDAMDWQPLGTSLEDYLELAAFSIWATYAVSVCFMLKPVPRAAVAVQGGVFDPAPSRRETLDPLAVL